MSENQNIEYKLNWRDEYLKWVAGFANAKGGAIYIGINDNGDIKGLKEHRKLLEDIPNKIIQQLGLVVDINLHQKDEKQYIEVVVPISSVPIAYHGSYYYRSGSTKQELKGTALQEFLLKKMGRTWDDLGIPNTNETELDLAAIQFFLTKATQSKRMVEESLTDSLPIPTQKLHLYNQDLALKNSAILLFGKSPLRYFANAYFKIGKFGVDDADLISQDVIEGPIIFMAHKVMEVLRNKYLKSVITYKGLQRIEELEYPEEALREAILNAIVHKDYTGTSIQLSIYDDKLLLWNPGRLPEDLTIAMLKTKHPSRPHNKNIAELFFKAGYIEVWGRGIAKMVSSCKAMKFPEPIISEYAGGIQVVFNKPNLKSSLKGSLKGSLKNEQKTVALIAEKPNITIPELAIALAKSTGTVKKYLQKLKQNDIITRKGAKRGGYWEIL